MIKIGNRASKGLALSVSAMALVISSAALAQDADVPSGAADDESSEQPAEVAETNADGTDSDEAIVVTGSRVKRTTFSSPSPIQIITTDSSQDAGLFDPSQILQRDQAAAGQQIDSTFLGFVLDNGPGQQTLNLRGLGEERTLILINGRRIAPSGVEGAPSAPSINLLPSSLVERYDLLLDGASSVYGSDAIAGVTNVILRKDFDGLELFASGSLNPMGGGDDYQVSAAYGLNLDRGFIGFGAEYDYRDEIRFKDRDFLAGCDTAYEITNGGEIRTVNLDDQASALRLSGGKVTTPTNECSRVGYGLSGSVQELIGRFGVLYFTPGSTNTGVPNFTESTISNTGAPADKNNDGVQDIEFADYSLNGAFPEGLFIPSQHRYNAMAYGEYTLPGDANITPFFEALYSRIDVEAQDTTIGQLAARVPDNNQFNPCNPAAPGGVDCTLLGNAFTGTAPVRVAGVIVSGAVPVLSRPGVRGDRDNFDTQLEQYRGVLGVRGDMPFVGPNWTFEVAGVYQKSTGTSSRIGTREDKLAFAIGIDPTRDFNGDGIVDNTSDANRDGVADRPGDGIADDFDSGVTFAANPILSPLFAKPITPCNAAQLANPTLVAPDLLQGCVPVNLFAPSLLGVVRGDFASQAERDYLLDSRDFDTTYTQKSLSGFVTGTLFDMPAGPLNAVLGLEWREDAIDSRPDFVAANGLILNFFSDQGAVGSKWIREAFGELDVPLYSDQPLMKELSLNLAGRITDEEFYGTNATYSVKGKWRPIESLMFRATYGTSFRAPNLRENFLLGQSGFSSIVDPCAIPSNAFVGNMYRPDLDQREATTLANCIREGRDPTKIGISTTGTQVFQGTSVEIARVGSLNLEPETSRAITAGASFEETFGGFRVALSGTYYDIKIRDSIAQPSTQFAVNDCFTRQDGIRSEFCDKLFPGKAPADLGLLSSADLQFFNFDASQARGIDLNADFGKDVLLLGRNVEFGLNLRANHLLERSSLFTDVTGVENFSEFSGQFGFPKWTGRATFTAEVDKLTFTWQTRYLGDMRQAAVGVDPLGDVFGFGPAGTPSTVGNTCLGGGSRVLASPFPKSGVVPGDDVFCRDIGYADDYFEHSASIRYRTDRWEARIGMTNIFDRAPPEVDPSEVQSISNVPIGAGYNLDGREFFGSIKFEF